MKITKVEIIPFSIPMRRIEVFATGSIPSLDHVLLRIHTDEGLVGQAEAPPRPTIYGESVSSIIAAVRDWLTPALIGSDPFEQDAIWSRIDRYEHNPTAKAAVDIALHDLMAQSAGVALHRYLGGWSARVKLCYIIGQSSPEETIEQILNVREKYGIDWFKLKVGVDFRSDLALVKTVRESVGEDICLYVDANHAYDAVSALKAMRSWEPYRLEWVEEPSPAADFRGRETIARASSLPMMADESCKTLASAANEAARGHCRLISVKTGGTGYRLSKKILDVCEAFGVIPVSGSQSDSDLGAIAGAHLNAASRLLARQPAELCSFLDAEGGLLAEPIKIVDGGFSLSDRPGLGVTIDDDKLARYRLDR